MKVTLINHTPYPLETLIYTKSTRLNMTASSFDRIKNMSQEDKLAEWDYMKATIKSSWEFVEFLFLIEGVSRAFTHQLVRHRIGTKFAQQSQRTVDMGGFDFVMPNPGRAEEGGTVWARSLFEKANAQIDASYRALVEGGVKPQDARALLPTNVATNINFGANLRTLHDMARLRLCTKTQGEFQDVFRAIRDAVEEKMPWAAEVLMVECCWTGTCAFPNFPTEDCVLKPHVYDPIRGESYTEGAAPWTLDELRELDRRHPERGGSDPVEDWGTGGEG